MSIPPVGIMDHIVKIVLEVSNAHVVAITQNAIIVAPTIDVGLVDQDEGDGGNLNTSSTESNNMITDSIANPWLSFWTYVFFALNKSDFKHPLGLAK